MSGEEVDRLEGGLVIERGVPIPGIDRGSVFTRALLSLEVGDSLFVPGKNPSDVSNRWIAVSKSTGRKFTSRKVEGGTRIWRVEVGQPK